MKTITKDKFLEVFPVFQNASEMLIRDILSASLYERVPHGTTMKLRGDPSHYFDFMLSGEKRIYRVSDTGREITLLEVGPGETCMFTVSSILSHTEYPANAVAITDVEMLLLPAEEFRILFNKYDELRQFVFSIINKSFAFVMELIDEITFRKMNERLIDYLVEKSEDGKLSATHQKIASDLGTAREVVSRLLKDFERQGMILNSRNHIQLTNL